MLISSSISTEPPSKFSVVSLVCSIGLFLTLTWYENQFLVSCSLLCFFKKNSKMGLSNFPTAAEGMLPVLVINSVLSVALLKNMVRSVLQVMGANMSSPNVVEEDPDEFSSPEAVSRDRRISITQFKSLCHDRFFEAKTSSSSSTSNSNTNSVECCVCLCRFEADEEVSELSCKHFFHKGCLEKWFHNKHETCPLCRSIE